MANLGRHEDALESYNMSIKIKPDNAEAWVARGLVLIRLKRYEEALKNLKRSIDLGFTIEERKLLKDDALLLAAVHLVDSIKYIAENNLGTAKDSLIDGINSGKYADRENFQALIFGYLKSSIKIGKLDFVKEAIDKIVSELGEDYGQLLRPFRIAIDYMKTKDVGILERLQVEEREIVQAIAGER
jgi:tetratricopeptide (TPR) repeat protein